MKKTKVIKTRANKGGKRRGPKPKGFLRKLDRMWNDWRHPLVPNEVTDKRAKKRRELAKKRKAG